MRLLTALLAATLPLLASGQAQLLPAGEFAARDGRPGPGKTWRVTEEKGPKLAAALNAVAAKTPIVIDYEHQTLRSADNGQKAPAAGWIKSATWRAGEGLFADVEWTAAAKASIAAGEYLYISPVITFDDTGEVTGVALAALTNYPALLGMDAVVAQLNTHFRTATPQETDMALFLASLLAAIGMPATTTEADALSAVSALKATADASKAGLVALRTELGVAETADQAAALGAITALKAPSTASVQLVAALQGQVATLQGELTALKAKTSGDQVTAAVDAGIAAGKLVAASRQAFIDMGTKDMALLTATLAAMPVIPGLNGQSKAAGTEGAEKVDQTAPLTADGKAVMAAFGLTAEQFAKGAPAAAAH